jgi:acyl-CoA thioesterase FadM
VECFFARFIVNLFMRCFWVLLTAWLGPRRTPLEACSRRFRVWPHDLGWRDHLPNYRFFSFLELGRFDLWHASRLPFSGRYHTRMIAAQELVYLRPIRPFSAFDCQTRLLGWDHKYCYYLHQVHCCGQLAAVGLVKEVCLRRGQVVAPQTVLQLPVQSAPVLEQWQRLQEQLKGLTATA